MRRLVAPLMLVLWASCAMAQTPPQTVDEAVERIDQIFQNPATDKPENEVYSMLGDALRQARAEGRLTRDWAIIYAMLSDGARNTLRNPAYALQVADEGLTLIAGAPDQWDYRAVLQVTRAYALADLGRLDEAVATARLALPNYRELWSDDHADEFATDAALWAKGDLTVFNTAATELATQALERAETAISEGNWARAVTLAASALLGEETGFDTATRRPINARADHVAAQGLIQLGRLTEAGNALLRALSELGADPWQPGAPYEMFGAFATDAPTQRRAFDVFALLAQVALPLDRLELALAALDEADRLAQTPADRADLLPLRAALLWRGPDRAAAIAVLQEAQAAALANGDTANAAMAGLYLGVTRTNLAKGDSPAIDPTPLAEATELAIATLPPQQHGFVWLQAAQALRDTTAFELRQRYAQNALAEAQSRLSQQTGSGFAADASRASLRDTVEEFLHAAHTGLSQAPGPLRVNCPAKTEIYGCTFRQR